MTCTKNCNSIKKNKQDSIKKISVNHKNDQKKILKIHINEIPTQIDNEEEEVKIEYDFLTKTNLIEIDELVNEDTYTIKHMINNMRANYFKEWLQSMNCVSIENIRSCLDGIPKFENNALMFMHIMNKKLNEFDMNIDKKIFEEIFIDCHLPNNNQNRIDVSKLIPIGYCHTHKFVSYFNTTINKVCVLPMDLYSFFVHYLPKWKEEQFKLKQGIYYD